MKRKGTIGALIRRGVRRGGCHPEWRVCHLPYVCARGNCAAAGVVRDRVGIGHRSATAGHGSGAGSWTDQRRIRSTFRTPQARLAATWRPVDDACPSAPAPPNLLVDPNRSNRSPEWPVNPTRASPERPVRASPYRSADARPGRAPARADRIPWPVCAAADRGWPVSDLPDHTARHCAVPA